MKIDFKSCSLEEILNYKTMYYDKIDFSIIEDSFNILKNSLELPYIIHIVGTNGKGSTGRFLAHYFNKIGKDTLHYSSPHIKNFNERVWINGDDVSNEVLNDASKKIQNILPLNLLEKLTYFEYTTLLAFVISDKRDFLVLEAGLGGEFDATNVAKNDLSLITTIGFDHQSFLGNSIEEISSTKIRSCDKSMIVGYQEYNEVFNIAKDIAYNKKLKYMTIEDFDTNISKLNLNIANYLKNNLKLSIAALKYLDIPIDLKYFVDIKLKGRCEKIASNITIDVGHNPLAAKSILKEFEDKKINLVYNSYKDKDYKEVLKILKPIIKSVLILPLDDQRIVKQSDLIEVCKNLNIISSKFETIKKDEEYLVFGSFLVVEKFLNSEIDS